ncbi:MAG: DUF488 domain-containing protein [Thermomicrobium sp.]|nr:DUF488 domain-containing protein [Thermomicrobium sp.]
MAEEPLCAPILTVGHSSRSLEEFLRLVRTHGVRTVVDVRRFPHSRRHPQFDRTHLVVALARDGIGYHHCPALGGRRQPRPDSLHRALENPGFRGFADHMQTPEFAAALEWLIDLARCAGPLALLCAEAVPWRCHRSLIADALVVRGYPVSHILGAKRLQPHRLPLFARVRDGHVIYDAVGEIGEPGMDAGGPGECG